jgi:hypothetical protein
MGACPTKKKNRCTIPDKLTTTGIRELVLEGWGVWEGSTHLKYSRCFSEEEEGVWEVWEVWGVWGVWEAREEDLDVEDKDASSDLADNICNYLFSDLNAMF